MTQVNAALCSRHIASATDLPPPCRTKLMEQSSLSVTAFRKNSLEKTLEIEFKNRGSAEQLHET